MPLRKDKKRRKRRRQRLLIFEDDGSISSTASSVYSSAADPDMDDFEMTEATKRYRQAFILMSAMAIFFALYVPTAVMKGLAGPHQHSRKSNVRKGSHSEEPARRTKTTDEDVAPSHAIEGKQKHKDSSSMNDPPTQQGNAQADDENDLSKMDFDTFLIKVQEVNKTQSQEPPSAEQATPSQKVGSSSGNEHSPQVVAAWQAMVKQQAQYTEQHVRVVVPPIENRFIIHLSAEQQKLILYPPNSLQQRIPEFTASRQSNGLRLQSDLAVGVRVGQTNNQHTMMLHQTNSRDSENDIGLDMKPRHSLQLNTVTVPRKLNDGKGRAQEFARGYLTNASGQKQEIQWHATNGESVSHRQLTDDTSTLQLEQVPKDSLLQHTTRQRELQQDAAYPQSQTSNVRRPADQQASQVLPQPQQGQTYPVNQRELQDTGNRYQQTQQQIQEGPQQQNQQQAQGYPQQQNQQQMQGYPQQQHQQQQMQRYPQQQNQKHMQGYPQNPIYQGHGTNQQQYQMTSNGAKSMNQQTQSNQQSSQASSMHNPNQQTASHSQQFVKQQDQESFQQQTEVSQQQQNVNQDGSQGLQGSGEGTSPQTEHLPSHVRICEIVLGQQEGSLLEEHRSCLDDVNPTLALAQIFLSAYLAHHARLHGYRVEYDHNCGRYRHDQRLIQELLPSPLTFPDSSNGEMDKEQLHGFCQMIIDSAQKKHEHNPLEILLWDTNPSTDEAAPLAMLERIAPLALSNLYKASMHSRLVKTSLQAGYGVLKGRDVTSEHVATDNAVIYLPCRDRKCEDLALIPYMNYLVHLPISISTVDIVVPPRCIQNLPGCNRYVNDLASTVRQFIPQVSVEVIQATPASPDTFARLIEAEHVLCSPGFGMTCLFPALGRNEGRVTLFDVGPDQVEGDSASSYISRLPSQMITHVTPPMSTFGVAFLSNFMGQDMAMSSFVQKSPDKDTGDCRFFRGRVGQWTQDMVYAKHAQYRTPLSHYSGNADKIFKRKAAKGQYGDMQFRPPTTYRWEELRYESCRVTQVTQEGVCSMLKSMNARRIFILGDSLNLQLAQSMWMWLTNANHGDSPTEHGQLDPNFKTTIQCMGYGSYTLQFIRNDEFLENDLSVSIDQEQKNCATYCFPWTAEYLADSSRTILIANMGAHIHEFERFQAAIDRFVDVFDGMHRPNDIVLFRTLVPGHWDCSRPDLKPFNSFAEYSKDAEEHPNPKEQIYTWSKFDTYNNYVTRKLDNRRFLQDTTGPRALMEVVDVNPMTTLRPDGHCSDEYRPPSYLETDCLHYSMPGPVDWWSHMAFSHLQDIATAENYLAAEHI